MIIFMKFTKFDRLKAEDIIITKGLRRKWIADKIGTSDRTLSAWLKGRLNPKLASIIALAQILGVNLEELIIKDMDE